MINKDILKRIILEEKKKYNMNLVEQAPAPVATTPVGGTPAQATQGAKPAIQTLQQSQQSTKMTPAAVVRLQEFINGLATSPDAASKKIGLELRARLASLGIK